VNSRTEMWPELYLLRFERKVSFFSWPGKSLWPTWLRRSRAGLGMLPAVLLFYLYGIWVCQGHYHALYQSLLQHQTCHPMNT